MLLRRAASCDQANLRISKVFFVFFAFFAVHFPSRFRFIQRKSCEGRIGFISD